MQHEWQFNVRGRRIVVTAVRAPNGKIIIRANARIVTTPLGEAERECFFLAEGAQFHLERVGGGIRVQEMPITLVAQPELDAAPGIVPQPESVQRRVVLFALAGIVQMIICILLRLLFAAEIARLEAAIENVTSQPGVEVLVAKKGAENTAGTVNAMKRAFTLEALVGLAMIVGAALLLLRVPWAPAALYFATWGILGVAVLSLIEIDIRAHRHFAFAFHHTEAAKFLRGVHSGGVFTLIIAAIATGVLLSLLNRRGLEEELTPAHPL